VDVSLARFRAAFEPSASLEHHSVSRVLRGHVLAAVMVIATLVVKSVVPLLGEAHPFVLLPIAIIVPAWYAGIGPAMLATLLCVLGADYLFLPPAEFGVDTDVVGLLALLGEGLVISRITAALHDARRSTHALAVAADLARREATLGLEMRDELLSVWATKLRGPLSDFTTTVEAARIAHRDGDVRQTALALEQLHSSAQLMRRTVEHWDERDGRAVDSVGRSEAS
jgi:hypothetical protein